MKHLLATLAVVLGTFVPACGGRQPPTGSSQHELDQKHCTTNAECASGLCSNGRCG